MDHTSCVCFYIGDMPPHPFPSLESVLQDSEARSNFTKFLHEEQLNDYRFDAVLSQTQLAEDGVPPATLADGMVMLERINSLLYLTPDSEVPTEAVRIYHEFLSNSELRQVLHVNDRVVSRAIGHFRDSMREVQEDLFARLANMYFPRFQFSQWMKFDCFFRRRGLRKTSSPPSISASPSPPTITATTTTTTNAMTIPATTLPSSSSTDAVSTSMPPLPGTEPPLVFCEHSRAKSEPQMFDGSIVQAAVAALNGDGPHENGVAGVPLHHLIFEDDDSDEQAGLLDDDPAKIERLLAMIAESVAASCRSLTSSNTMELV
jgi:hypothetical protein